MDGRPTHDNTESAARHRWHHAAERAAFSFFEPVASGRTSVWAGGFGWSTDRPNRLAVHALIDRTEVVVDTLLPHPRSNTDLRTRLMLTDLLHKFVLEEEADLELPLSINVIPENRTISLAGRQLQFTGMRISGGTTWAGEIEHDGVLVKVITSVAAPPFSIEPCRDWSSIPEHPPPEPKPGQ